MAMLGSLEGPPAAPPHSQVTVGELPAPVNPADQLTPTPYPVLPQAGSH